MPETGIEPVRGLARRILSPVRLPVPPLGHIKLKIWQPPTLPVRLQTSTIGRLGLNLRVRYGNGCVP